MTYPGCTKFGRGLSAHDVIKKARAQPKYAGCMDFVLDLAIANDSFCARNEFRIPHEWGPCTHLHAALPFAPAVPDLPALQDRIRACRVLFPFFCKPYIMMLRTIM